MAATRWPRRTRGIARAAAWHGSGRPAGLIPLTVPEIRRLLARLWVVPPPDVGAIWRWSRWRRRHQAIARSCHYRRRAAPQLQLSY